MFLAVPATILAMTGEAWSRLAEYVVERRVQLGMRYPKDLAERMDMNVKTVDNIEHARRTSYDRGTKVLLETALRWSRGSIDKILAGGEPTVVGPSTQAAAYVTGRDGTTHIIDIKDTRGLSDEAALEVVNYYRHMADDIERQISARRPEPVEEPERPGTGARPGADT